MKHKKSFLFSWLIILLPLTLQAEDGHRLWLRSESNIAVDVRSNKQSETIRLAESEIKRQWMGKEKATVTLLVEPDNRIKGEGYILKGDTVQASTDRGILYGAFALLRHQQNEKNIAFEVSNPSYERRILNHWDNLDGSVERGYAGRSIFWHGEDSLAVTEADRQRWTEYARANASIGINGAAINNVNASPKILTDPYLERVKTIADILRPYGMKVYLSVNFATPMALGILKTADPLDREVRDWWKEKIAEIYSLVPDFGGFLIKANSEGQPGPWDFERSHVEGANLFADLLEPFGGIVMWRAFVYSANDEDRAKQAYDEFIPFDGEFRDNVIIQVKNGPIDFQPREPFSPLFGAMKKTPIMPELQITQEYLGQSVHLVFLAPMWEEFLQSDTYQEGVGSTVTKTTDGNIFDFKTTAIAGVANIGLDENWCGHPFAQANWYAYGRLAWNANLSSAQIADEWIKQTFYGATAEQHALVSFSDEWRAKFLEPVKIMLLQSREAAVDYMMPLGLHHLFAANEHYGPGPWWAPEGVRKDWTPPYFHQADSLGIGFDRSSKGSNAVTQYQEPLRTLFEDPETCPEIYLLWFHHLPWDYTMKDGSSLWEAIAQHYQNGLDQVRTFQTTWDQVKRFVDPERFEKVQTKLRLQTENAQLWKDAVLLYFQRINGLEIPMSIERPVHDLDAVIEKDNRRLRKRRN